jgi:hypothetical protein
MASIISAGTTTTTALVQTADTSGILQFQTNGTTTALTIDTSQNVGVGATSPATYGKLVVFGGGFTQLATIALPATSGSTRSDFTRILDSAGSRSLDSSISNNGAWIQSRDKNDYTVNYDLLLQPNGGKLGIGTTSPNNLVTIQGDATGSSFADNGVGQLVIRGATSTVKRLGLGIDTTNNLGVIQAQNYGTGAYPLVLNPAGGNVGIGTSTFSNEKLAVSASMSLNNNGGAAYYFRNGASSTTFGYVYHDSTNMTVQNAVNGYLNFATNNVECGRFDSPGGFLIASTATSVGTSGTTLVEGLLRIGSSVGSNYTAMFIAGATTYAGLKIKVGASDIAGGVAGYDFTVRPSYSTGVGASGDVSAMYVITGYSRSVPDVAMVKDGGNFFIGKSVPGNANGYSFLPNLGGTGIPLFDIKGNSTSNNYTIIQAYSNASSAYAFYIQWNGQIYAQVTSISSVSDQSLKQNIRPLETGIAQIMALQPRRFDWIDGRAENVAGFIAQEVQSVLPDLVESSKYSENKDGSTEYKLNIRMSDMIPTMVKAIQELSAQVTTLQTQVTALQAKG